MRVSCTEKELTQIIAALQKKKNHFFLSHIRECQSRRAQAPSLAPLCQLVPSQHPAVSSRSPRGPRWRMERWLFKAREQEGSKAEGTEDPASLSRFPRESLLEIAPQKSAYSPRPELGHVTSHRGKGGLATQRVCLIPGGSR